MTEVIAEVFGRPVTGDIRQSESRAEQWPDEQFLPLLDALLDVHRVEAVRWSQYTPYFNDGDPCVFSVREAEVRFSEDETDDEEDGDTDEEVEDDEDDEDDYDRGDFVSIYDMTDYDPKTRESTVEPQFTNAYKVLKAFNDAVDHFEDLLRTSFGDHAEITATKKGFNVGEYSHD